MCEVAHDGGHYVSYMKVYVTLQGLLAAVHASF